MKYYFGTTSQMSLTYFGYIHIFLIIGTVLSIYLIYHYRNYLKNHYNLKILGISILFINMIIYSLGALMMGNYDIKIHLPIHYCYITGFLFIYMILAKKEKMFNYLYYAIFFCTTTVIIFQDPSVAYDRYDFIMIIISHHFLLINSFFVLYVLDYKVNKKGLKYFLIYSIIVYSLVWGINQILNTNYIFNKNFPDFMYEIYPFLKLMPTQIWLALLSIPLLYLSYLPIHLKNKSNLLDKKKGQR